MSALPNGAGLGAPLDEHKQWFDAKFPPQSVSRDDEREYVLRRFYDNDVMVTMTFLDDGKTADLFIPASHRAAVAAALCPPAPGEVRLTLTQETAQRLIRILEPVQDAALRDATYDMDTWLACQDVMTQIDGQTPLTFSAAPEQKR